MEDIRYANIGIAVGIVIAVAGVLAFKDSNEGAMQVVALVGLLTGLFVALALGERAKRRSGKHVQ